LALGAPAALGDKVLVLAKKSSTEINDWPPYLEDTTYGAFYPSSGNSNVTEDQPPKYGTRFGYSGYPAITVKPTLANAGGVYRIDVTLPTSSSIPSDVTTKMTAVGCTLSTNMTLAMGGPQNQWNFVCYITNDVGVTEPEITFTYSDTLIDGTTAQAACSFSRRWYPAPLRFTAVGDPCLATPALPQVYGPLVVDQTYVDVPGVATNATAVTVYADGVQIGSKTNDVTPGVNRVTTSPLVKDAKIVATQTVNGQEGCAPNAGTYGPKVGSGANQAIYVSLILDQNAALTGPVGTNATPTGAQYHIPYLGLSGGYGTAPLGGVPVYPSGCWQTVTITPGTDPQGQFVGAVSLPDPNPFAALAGIGFELGDVADTGPYDLYIDNIVNGDVVIEDFESYTNGQPEVLFSGPAAAGILGGDSIGVPRISQVSTNTADTGNNSLRYSWQFKDTLNTLWQRAVANGPGAAIRYPVVDLSKPISFRLLLLPVGETTTKLSVGPLPSQTKSPGQSVTFTALARGEGPFTYQWKKDGIELSGETNSTYTIASVTPDHAGAYTVVVDNDACDPVESSPAQLIVQTAPTPVTITAFAGTSLSYTGGSGTQFVLLKSSDIAAPLSAWTRAATNTATPGSFTIPAVGTPPAPVFYSIVSE